LLVLDMPDSFLICAAARRCPGGAQAGCAWRPRLMLLTWCQQAARANLILRY
jgi:hypothetical protein